METVGAPRECNREMKDKLPKDAVMLPIMSMLCHKCGKGIGTMIFRSDAAVDLVTSALKRSGPIVTCPECNKLVKFSKEDL
jgi:hypothetical protein